MIAAEIDGRGRVVHLSVMLRERVPRRMPDDRTVMSVETSIDRRGKTYSVYADADAAGWTAYLSQNGDTMELVDAFSINGSATTISIPWAMIGGAGSFKWSASTAWTRTTLTSTYFSFDSAPERGKGRYPDS